MTTEQEQEQQDWYPGITWVPGLFKEYARLRAGCPVPYTTEYGGYWTLLNYEDVRHAAADPTAYRSGRPFLMDVSGDVFIPESLNPPEHTAYRRLLIPHFRPPRMKALEPTVRAYAVEHLRGILESGAGDFVAEVAYALPTRVLCAFLSIPDEMWTAIKRVTWERTVKSGDAEGAHSATSEFFGRIGAILAERRHTPLDPVTDLFTALINAKIDGESLSDGEIAEIGYQVMLAGADTTSSSLGNAVYLLAANPDQQDKLRADPSLIPAAVEEVLRMEPALHSMGRTTACPVTVGGRTLAEGETVSLNFAAANRDPVAFPEPDTFDVTREPNRHLTFGHGIHKCVGAPLARLELAVVLHELLGRTSEVRFDGEPKRGSIVPAAFKTVPIRVTPR